MSDHRQRRGKIAKRVGLCALIFFALVAIFADFLAPYDLREQSRREPSAPVTSFTFDGGFSAFGVRMTDAVSQKYEADAGRQASVAFFAHGYSYLLFGIIPTDRHLFGTAGPADDVRIRLLGSDPLGRDRFSRLLMAIRFSLIVCPLGALLASLLGILIGIISGYASRYVDATLMGVTDAVISLPTLIVILAVRVAFPLELPPLTAAAMIIGIFALTGWAEMARLTRGLVIQTREAEYVAAAKVSGVRSTRILFRHILPNISRPLITQATLILPAFLLAEAALSFLGVGLQEPAPSLGNMLSEANEVTALQNNPLLVLAPAIVIAAFVLAVRLLSSGLKEANEL